ncbi:MAG: translation initiation factor IF-2 [Phycisphaerales bacterium]|nr:translation initiation factor IF-2 [Phycisphaerales bacterium]
MATRRVHEIARELGVKSKAIVDKCTAEGIPGINNHMSSISAGLEATIREWFSTEEGGGTAVETAAKVDIAKVRVTKRATKKKAAAKKKTTEATEEPGDESGGVAVEEAPPARPAPKAPAAKPMVTAPPPAPPTAKPPAPAATVPAAAPEQDEDDGVAPTAPAPKAPEAPLAPAAKAPKSEPKPPTPEAPPKMNVPTRPRVVAPAGPMIHDVQKKPARLSGPTVVRVEAPEQLEAPRRRPPGGPGRGGPRGGVGVPMAPMEPGPDDPSRNRRNRRRSDDRTGTKRGSTGRGPEEPDRGATRDADGRWRYQDLVEREERLSRSEGFLRQRRRDQKSRAGGSSKTQMPVDAGGAVKINAPFTIKDLSAATGVRSADIVKKLFLDGVIATPNSAIEPEKAQELMMDYDIELEVITAASGEAAVIEEFEKRETINERSRPPVVTILGHVDHGKTSLLDYIRKANVAKGEAGGITQATSAFLVDVKPGEDTASHASQICFLDTPGHEAFTEMRSRGAHMTDIIVLVIAADDGVMPQTVESINHAKAAGVPIIVALNKFDLPGAEGNLQKIYGQLAEHELNPSEWGGDTEVIKTSATQGTGVQDLLEMLAYTAELKDFKADFEGPAQGTVVESQMIDGRGATANLLVQQGELKVGDFIVAGRAFGRVRDLTNDRGERVKQATPSTPVQISGLDELPTPGDKFYIVKTLRKAQDAAEQRRAEERERQLAQPKVTLDSMFAQMGAADTKELLVVLKADVQGSIDAIRKSIENISTDEIKVRVLHTAVGGITESDVQLSSASGAIIFGFNVIPSGKARRLAEDKGVEIRSYRVIYDIVDDVKKAATGMLSPEVREEVLGHAEVRQVFKISKVGAVAGCYVTNGTIERNAFIRVTRNDIVIEQDRVLEQLKRFKDDAKEVKSGQECGMKIQGYDDIKEGDILECFRKTEVARAL